MTTQTSNRGNGKRVFHPEAFSGDSVLRPGKMGGEAQKLIEPGKEITDILMKADFIDINQAKAAAMAINFCRHYKLPEEEQMVWDCIAAMTAVEGKRAFMFLQGITGVVMTDHKGKLLSQKGKGDDHDKQKGKE